MTNGPPPYDDLSAVLKAALSPSSRPAVDRLVCFLSEFADTRTDLAFRVLSDFRLDGAFGADLLLQIDDYDVRLKLLDPGFDGGPVLDRHRLEQIISLLENNPNTAALVLVWATDDQPAVHLSMARARAAAANPAVMATLLSMAQPLPEVLRAIVQRQLPEWGAEMATLTNVKGQALDTHRLFERAVVQAIETERHRTYRSQTRKQAALQFPVEEETRVILDTLAKALAGAPAFELIAELTNTRRGA